MTGSGGHLPLLGRRGECRPLDQLLTDVRAGGSGTVVLRGEAGIGKTELLKYLRERAEGCRTVQAVGVQSEMEISYAALQQFCAPLLEGLAQLPAPQQDALATAFGLQSGSTPDRFLVALATLSLLAHSAGERPLVCLIDDAQWLDQASAAALAFVARRLVAESVVLVFAVRDTGAPDPLAGLPELRIAGLTERDSRTLLESAVTGPLDDRVRDRIVAEARGNPLALLELPRTLTAAELSGGLGGSGRRPLTSQIERGFRRRIDELPSETQRLLVLAASEPVGDVTLLRRAAARLGIDADEAAARGSAPDLFTLDTRVRFRHPLVRSAAYQQATVAERQAAHRALAESIDESDDPDRRAWHRAQAVDTPDDRVALELERSAGRAQARGGAAAVAAFLERSAELTEAPAARAERTLRAAQAQLQAGDFDAATALLARAEAGPADEVRSSRIDALRAGVAVSQGRGNEAIDLLLGAAHRVEKVDAALARGSYLEAVVAVIFAGHLAGDLGYVEVGGAARSAPPAPDPQLPDDLLDALAVRLTDGFAASIADIERVLTRFCDEQVPVHQALRWLLLAGVVAADLWDLDRWHEVAARHVRIAREAGALSELPLALDSCAVTHVFAGELEAAQAAIDEGKAVSAAIGSSHPPFGALTLAAVRGGEMEARALITSAIRDTTMYGQGIGLTHAHIHHAVLCNGLGQYDEALPAARRAASSQQEFGSPRWALAELVEAAVRCGDRDEAADALERLAANTQVSATDWALGMEARSRALVNRGDAAEVLYREAIERLERTRVRTEAARAHLLYGEWLRRENRRADARRQLGIAHEMLSEIGAQAFAERARRELEATGATVPPRTVDRGTTLTPQEAQIARMAGDGLTNAEIGARLFLSPHTVDWHLRKVFTKLGISSRRDLAGALTRDRSSSA